MPSGVETRGIQAELYEPTGEWKHPCPHQVALDTVDEFLRTHSFTMDELLAIRKYYGSKRVWAIRHLRLSEAERRIHATIGRSVIILDGVAGSPSSDQGRCEPKNKARPASPVPDAGQTATDAGENKD